MLWLEDLCLFSFLVFLISQWNKMCLDAIIFHSLQIVSFLSASDQVKLGNIRKIKPWDWPVYTYSRRLVVDLGSSRCCWPGSE